MAPTPRGKPEGESVPGIATVQFVWRLPVVVTLSVNEQSVTEPTSMYWSSQKRLPVGAEHLVVQPPVRELTQVSLHVMFACTVQDPLQQS
jgi:hypothetical protein